MTIIVLLHRCMYYIRRFLEAGKLHPKENPSKPHHRKRKQNPANTRRKKQRRGVIGSPDPSPINLRSLLPKFSIIPYLYHCGRNISINRFPPNHRVIYYRANNQSNWCHFLRGKERLSARILKKPRLGKFRGN